jgi:hypothetical protein
VIVAYLRTAGFTHHAPADIDRELDQVDAGDQPAHIRA